MQKAQTRGDRDACLHRPGVHLRGVDESHRGVSAYEPAIVTNLCPAGCVDHTECVQLQRPPGVCMLWRRCAASQHMPSRARRRPSAWATVVWAPPHDGFVVRLSISGCLGCTGSCGRDHTTAITDVVWDRRERRWSVGGCPWLVWVVWARPHDHDKLRHGHVVWARIAVGARQDRRIVTIPSMFMSPPMQHQARAHTASGYSCFARAGAYTAPALATKTKDPRLPSNACLSLRSFCAPVFPTSFLQAACAQHPFAL